MIKQTIDYTDYDGKKKSEDFWFNLTKADLAEMALSQQGLDVYFRKIAETQDAKELFRVFRDLVGRAVGYRPDGKRFIKTQDFAEEFLSSEAYSELFMKLIQDPAWAAEFFKGMIPSELQEELEKPEDKEYTDDELLAMSDSEFSRVAGTDLKDMTKHHLLLAFERKNQQHKLAS